MRAKPEVYRLASRACVETYFQKRPTEAIGTTRNSRVDGRNRTS